jgi:hypothetical protein
VSKELVASHDLARVVRKCHQKVELVPGQIPRFAFELNRASRPIDRKTAEAECSFLTFRADGAALSADERPKARQELARIERLGQIVVGPELEADDSVGILTARGQHQDRHVTHCAQPREKTEPIEPGKHYVEHHDVEGLPFQLAESVLRVLRPVEGETVARKILGDHRCQNLVVVDEEHT